MDEPQTTLQGRVKLSHNSVLISYTLLLVGLAGSVLSSDTDAILLIPALGPLLIFLPGIRKSDPRSLILLCFVSLLYFCVITANVFEPDRSAYDILALAAVVVLFIAAMLSSRWQKNLTLQEADL